MSSINVLYRNKASSIPNGEPVNVHGDLHINYWKLPRETGGYNRAIDFGVYLEELTETIVSLTITVPFRVDKTSIVDLSQKLSNEDFISYLFGGSYQILSLKDCPTYKYAKDLSGKKSFCIYELCSSSIKVSNLEKGSKIVISIQSEPKGLNEIKETVEGIEKTNSYNLYLRFRIQDVEEGSFCFTEDISNDFIQSAFSRSEMTNIKINELREIDHNDVQELTSQNSFVTFKKLHFFFIGSSEDEAVSGSTPYESCSLLEPTIWKDYISDLNPRNKKCISYHWSSVEAEKHNIFFKTVYSNRNLSKLAKYAFVVIVLSMFGSMVYDIGKNVICVTNKYIQSVISSKSNESQNNDSSSIFRDTTQYRNKYNHP